MRWRFLLAFQCFPALILVSFIKMLPDSPRYLASVGRNEEAHELLGRIRNHKATPEEINQEYLEIVTLANEGQRSSPIQFAKILIGKGSKTHTNLGRRAWLCIWLQIMASWTGITVRTFRSFSQAVSNLGQSRLSPRIPRFFCTKLDTVPSSRTVWLEASIQLELSALLSVLILLTV